MRQKLTVLIPCKNERQNIRECIESVRPIADEILVADSGSTDGTLDIVRRAGGCRLIEHPWTGYAAFKNWAMTHATHGWILFVDADERVTPELVRDIQRLMDDPPQHLDAYSVRFQTYFMGRLLRYSSWNNPAIRLIRNGCSQFVQRRVHERLEVPPERTGRLTGKLQHFSFWSYDAYFQKYVRYSKLSAEELYKQGKRVGVYDLLLRPFLRFLQLYFVRGGILDGIAGIQICMLTAFFYSFAKQARLWEMQNVVRQAEPEPAADAYPRLLPIGDLAPDADEAIAAA